jgi:RNA polymerase sigma-70 factor, ECF subfamily
MSDWQNMGWHELLAELQKEEARRHARKSPRRGEEAWVEVLRRVRGMAYGMLQTFRGISIEDIDDIAQGVMLKLQSSLVREKLHSSSSAVSYLLTMVRNSGLDLVRSRGLEKEMLSQVIPREGEMSPLFGADLAETLAALRRILVQLPDDDRLLLELRFEEGYPLGEIADRLNISYSATAVRLFRLLRQIRAELEQTGG